MDIQDGLTHLAGVLRTRKKAGARPYHLFLTRSLSEYNIREGYGALARLIRAGYFSTILTSNTDTSLEVALQGQDCYSPQYRVLVVGQASDEQIAATLEGQESGIHIVKLYAQRLPAEQTLFSDELPPDIQISLRRYFNRNIIIVGSMAQEEGGISALHFHKEGGIYYVREDMPPPDDIVVKCLHKQDKQLKHFFITGTYGECNMFFSTLERSIQGRTWQNQNPPLWHHSDTVTGKVPISHTYSSGQSARQQYSPPVPRSINVLYIYSPKDENLKERIQAHLSLLSYDKLIKEQHSEKFTPGIEWSVETRKKWDEIQVFLLLVSVDFISSSTYDLAGEAMKRHEAKTAVVIPIILRPCEWKRTFFGPLQALPNNRPINSWSNRDQALSNVAQGIRAIIEGLRDHTGE